MPVMMVPCITMHRCGGYDLVPSIGESLYVAGQSTYKGHEFRDATAPDGKLIDFGKQQEFPARDLIREMIEWFKGAVPGVIDSWACYVFTDERYHLLVELTYF